MLRTTTVLIFAFLYFRWTEGLISAAKAVGLGAKLLVDAADKVVLGSGKFEEIMAASQVRAVFFYAEHLFNRPFPSYSSTNNVCLGCIFGQNPSL